MIVDQKGRRRYLPVSGTPGSRILSAVLPLKLPGRASESSSCTAFSAAVNPELLHPELERAAVEAKPAGGPTRPRQNPTGLFQRRQNVGAFDLLQGSL